MPIQDNRQSKRRATTAQRKIATALCEEDIEEDDNVFGDYVDQPTYTVD